MKITKKMKILKKSLFTIIISSLLLFTSCTKNEVTQVTIDKPTLDLVLGQVDSLFANTEYTGTIVPAVTWTSSNPDVATIKNGEVVALKKGTSVISAQAGNKTASCNITVNNEIFPTLVKGEIWYFGDIYDSGTSNNFLVCLAGQNINMDNLTGDGDVLFLEFNTELTVKNNVPTGIYNISESFEPGTMVPGWVESSGDPWGTWFFGKTYNDVITGFVQVTNNNEGNYKFVLNLSDYFGNSITGTYQMNLSFFDLTDEQTPASSNKLIAKYQDHFEKIIAADKLNGKLYNFSRKR